MGAILYTAGALFHVEWCIRQLLCPSIISHNITSITHDQYTNTNIYPLVIYTYLYLISTAIEIICSECC